MGMAYTANDKLPKIRADAVRMVRSGKSTREVARYFGYAQSTIVKWCARAPKTWDAKEIKTLCSRPHKSPQALNREIVARIVHTRMESKRCAEVVHHLLKKDGVEVSLSSVKRILDRYHLLKKRSPWKKKRRYLVRPDVAQPGDVVELDTVHFVDKHKKRSYMYTAIDLYSRYTYAMVSPCANTWASVQFLKQLRRRTPFTVRCIQTDNGPEFSQFFTDTAVRMGVSHRHIHPRSPNENGHLERFNRTIQEEMPRHQLCMFRPQDIRTYLKHYNTERPHMGIDFKTPMQMINK